MLDFEYLSTIPSYLRGSVRQTLATLAWPRSFARQASRPVVLVPGAFCTASVMNDLGDHLANMGYDVHLAPNFPYYFSALANTCRLELATDRFLEFLQRFDGVRPGAEIDVVAHSNGGLITLLAQQRLDETSARAGVHVGRLITMATPFGGFPGAPFLAPVIPCCRDLLPDCEALRRAAKANRLVKHCLVSDRDTLIPFSSQIIDGRPYTVMSGFQHMDFIVGSKDRVARTAHEVVRWLADGK